MPAGYLTQVVDGVAAGVVDGQLLAAIGPDRLALSLDLAGGQRAPRELLMVGDLVGATTRAPTEVAPIRQP